MAKQTKKKPAKSRVRSVQVLSLSKLAFNKRVALIALVIVMLVGTLVLAFSRADDPNSVSTSIIKTAYCYPTNSDPLKVCPTGTLYVSPSGNDAASGSVNEPLKTIAGAAKKAASGGTIVVRGGVYRESVGTIEKALTIQPYPGEEVWLDGSDVVSGWVQDGTNWRKDGWSAGNQLCPNSDCSSPLLVTVDNPQAGLPDMVFMDGVAQRQVGQLSELTAGTFYVDRAGQRLYLGTNPSGKTIEASTRREALFYLKAGTAGSKLRGIGVRRFAGNIEFSDRAKPGQINVTSGARGIEFDNMVFAQGAANGLFVAGLSGNSATGITIKNSVFASNGASGVSATRVDGLTMDNNIFYNNDNEKPNADGDYGSYAGSKLTYATNSVIRNNLFQDNFGTGFWCDLSCDKVNIIGNMTKGNTLHGIFYEVSSNAIIASNVAASNGQWGLKVGGRGIKVFNNTVYNNVSDGLVVYDDSRLTSLNIEVKNNIVASGPRTSASSHLMYMRPNMSNTSVAITGLDSNLYFRATSSSPKYILGWQGTNIDAHFSTLDATLRTQTGREANGILVENTGIGSLFKDAPNNNFQLVSGAKAQNSAESVPSDVAAAIGQSGGQITNRGAVSWKNGSSNNLSSSTPDPVVTPPAPVNQAPSATVNLSGNSFTSPASFQVSAFATDTDGSITKLEILQNNAVVYTCYNSASCRYDANGYGAGTFQYAARAYDNATPNAAVASSTALSLVVANPVATPAPTPVPAPSPTPTQVPAPQPALSQPTGLRLGLEQGFLTYGIGINWNAVPGASAYRITPAGRATVTRTSPSFVDSPVTIGSIYSYDISAINGTTESPKASLKAKVTCGFWVFNCKVNQL